MTRTQAISIFLKHSKVREEIIRRLMLWNNKLSMIDNCKRIGVRQESLRPMVRRYKLDYKK